MINKGYIEKRLKRLHGASAETRERMEAANASQIFTAKCRICGKTLHGTPAELATHKHEGV